MLDFGDLLGKTRFHAGPALYALGNAGSVEYLKALTEAEWLSRATPERVTAVTRARLHRYLRYCQTYSAFWRERWPSQWSRFAEEESEAVLADLPALTKSDLREHGDALRIEPSRRRPGDGFPGVPGQMENFSGGSTGVPTRVWQDLRFAARNRALIDHAYRTVGLVPGRPTFYLWGSNNELKDLEATRRKKLSTWMRGLIALPSFFIDAKRVRAYAAQINATPSVDQALCFVHALDSFTSVLERDGIELRRLRRVVTGGGKLHASLRARAMRLMADDIYEIYGGRDVGLLGVEAPAHQGLLTFPWHNHIEVLHEGKPVAEGESGEVHVSCLQNFSFALLKLGLGDVATRRAQGEGENRPGLSAVTGRVVEYMVGPGGAKIDPVTVVHLVGVLEERPWIRRFQVVQTGYLSATLRIETWSEPAADVLEQYRRCIEAALGRLFGAPYTLSLEIVAAIAPAASGKHFYIVGWSPSA